MLMMMMMMLKLEEYTEQMAARGGRVRGYPLGGNKYGAGRHLLWLKVYELSRLLSCCKRACIIPVLLRDTGRV